MGRGDRLSGGAALAKTSEHHTPHAGIFVCFIAQIVFLASASPLTNKFVMFEFLFVGNGLIYLSILLLLVAGAHKVTRGRGGFTRPVLIAGAILMPLFAMYGTLVPFPHGPARNGLWLSAAIVILSGGWALRLGTTRPTCWRMRPAMQSENSLN